jgi:hypothetical protein
MWRAKDPANITVLLAVLFLTGCFKDAAAQASVWEDANCDGQRGEDEVPLYGVCVWAAGSPYSAVPQASYCAYSQGQTNSQGYWSDFTQYYGGCGDIFIFIRTLDGFQPTTDTVVNDCVADFGLARSSTCPQRSIVTPADLVAEQRRKRAITALALGAVVAAVGLSAAYWLRRWQRLASAEM